MRELERKVLELRRSGFAEDSIRGFVNASKQNAQATTESALREHFILEQIAEEENVDADDADYDAEIALIAQQSDTPERRVRARLYKQGQMDALRNQIVERKVIEMIVESATVTEEPVDKTAGEDAGEFAVYTACSTPRIRTLFQKRSTKIIRLPVQRLIQRKGLSLINTAAGQTLLECWSETVDFRKQNTRYRPG